MQMFIPTLFVIAPNWKQITYLSHRWMVQQTVVRLYHGAYSAIYRSELLIHTTEPGWVAGNYAEWIQPIPQGYILYGSIHDKFIEMKNRLVVVRSYQWVRDKMEGGCGCKRATWGILVVGEMFCVLTVLVLIDPACWRKWGKSPQDLCILLFF